MIFAWTGAGPCPILPAFGPGNARMDISTADRGALQFGPFVLDPTHRRLTRDGQAVKLGSRQFDLLVYLARNAGRVVDKDELMSAVWGGRIVEESNLSQAVFGLRRALECGDGDSVIQTAPGRGYVFTALVRPAPCRPENPAAAPSSAVAPAAMAARPRRMIPGRLGLGAAAILAVCAAAWLLLRPRAPHVASFDPPAHSVAVLAFSNMSGDAAQDYVADGLSEELIGSLSRIDGLNVAARTSSFSFKGKAATIGDIARALGVGAVLEGSVRRNGHVVRVSAQLINARTGFPFWSRRYDRDAGDILNLQTEIAGAVVQALTQALAADDVAKLTVGNTRNAAAYDAYLRGIALMTGEDESSSRAALAQFDDAVRLDPDYAAAHAQRARLLAYIANSAETSDLARVHDTLLQAMAAADRAVALAPHYGPAHTARGLALEMMLNVRAAETEMRRGHMLAPGSPDADLSYAYLEAVLGHAREAEMLVRQVLVRDPLSAFAYLQLVEVLYYGRQYAAMADAVQHIATLGGAESLDGARYYVANAALAQGKFELALRICEALPVGDGGPCVAVAAGRLGRTAQAADAMAKFRAIFGDNGAVSYAEIAAQGGDGAAAMTWLETAYRGRDTSLLALRTDPLLDPVRGEARFADLERRLDFPP
jgi:serine/threonine-protein kinase